ncbi:hypothetical protein VSK91_16420 [Bacillus swezeyi]|uniref:hypothetical protein n=1 Tax=Bacillus swezeyi TaxID=1925020 RepID=UPI0039C6E0CD
MAERYKTFLHLKENFNKSLVIENPAGDITAMLRQMGHPSVMTDYGLYLYKNKNTRGLKPVVSFDGTNKTLT